MDIPTATDRAWVQTELIPTPNRVLMLRGIVEGGRGVIRYDLTVLDAATHEVLGIDVGREFPFPSRAPHALAWAVAKIESALALVPPF